MASTLNIDAGWLGAPKERTKAKNALGLFEPNANGVWDNYSEIINNFNVRLGQRNRAAGGGATTTAAPSSRFSLLSLSKDPTLQPLLDTAVGGLGRRSATNAGALDRFNLELGRNSEQNALDLGQESLAVDDVFSGRLGERLGASSVTARADAEAGNAADETALRAIRDKYGVDQKEAIRLLYGNLGAQRDKFRGEVLGDIGNEVARRNIDLTNFAGAARVSTDQAIADAVRQNNAQFGQEGGGGSSYASRLGMGQRIRANTVLTQALAELRMSNTEKELGRRGALTEQLGSLERGDIAGEGQAGIGLTSDLNAQDYRNLGATSSRRMSIEDAAAARDLATIQYEQGQRNALLGARAGLRRSSVADTLGGISANQAFDSGEIRNLGALGEIRRANQFLGIDDGTGDALTIPRIPNFSRGGGGPVDYPDDGYFSPVPQDGQRGDVAGTRTSTPGYGTPALDRQRDSQGRLPNQRSNTDRDFFYRYGVWPEDVGDLS